MNANGQTLYEVDETGDACDACAWVRATEKTVGATPPPDLAEAAKAQGADPEAVRRMLIGQSFVMGFANIIPLLQAGPRGEVFHLCRTHADDFKQAVASLDLPPETVAGGERGAPVEGSLTVPILIATQLAILGVKLSAEATAILLAVRVETGGWRFFVLGNGKAPDFAAVRSILAQAETVWTTSQPPIAETVREILAPPAPGLVH